MILSSNIWDCELNGTLTAIGLFWRFCKKEKHKWISTRLITGEVHANTLSEHFYFGQNDRGLTLSWSK